MARCEVCFRHCEIKEGQAGFCKARICKDGRVVPANYGWHTAIHIDPIEKKPIARFYPGSKVLSVGSYGCNLRCPFCQNHEISWDDIAMEVAAAVAGRLTGEVSTENEKEPSIPELRGYASSTKQEDLPHQELHSYTPPINPDDPPHPELYSYVPPELLVESAIRDRWMGVIGIAYTYNEPLIGYEYVLDTARLAHAKGLKNVLVTNGTAETSVLEKLLPYIDAMNVDLKGFTDRYYEKVLGGNREMVMNFIERAVKDTHVELTTLIIPGENDTEGEMQELTAWVSNLRDRHGELIGRQVPLHISRFFPRFHMTDRPATDVEKVYRLAEVARQKLEYVYTGNC